MAPASILEDSSLLNLMSVSSPNSRRSPAPFQTHTHTHTHVHIHTIEFIAFENQQDSRSCESPKCKTFHWSHSHTLCFTSRSDTLSLTHTEARSTREFLATCMPHFPATMHFVLEYTHPEHTREKHAHSHKQTHTRTRTVWVLHAATHCNTQQHPATPCNTLQHVQKLTPKDRKRHTHALQRPHQRIRHIIGVRHSCHTSKH